MKPALGRTGRSRGNSALVASPITRTCSTLGFRWKLLMLPATALRPRRFLGNRPERAVRPLAVTLAGPAPEYRQCVAVVGDALQTEPVSGAFGQQRVDLDRIVRTRAETDQAGDHEVAEGRVVVVTAACLRETFGSFAFVGGLPPSRPRARAAVVPAFVRS